MWNICCLSQGCQIKRKEKKNKQPKTKTKTNRFVKDNLLPGGFFFTSNHKHLVLPAFNIGHSTRHSYVTPSPRLTNTVFSQSDPTENVQ